MNISGYSALLLSFLLCLQTLQADTGRYRLSYQSDPSTSIVIGWDQLAGHSPVLHYDVVDHGRNVAAYAYRSEPASFNQEKRMKNFFVSLTGLQPDTKYYFIIQDSEGISRRYFFQTIPDHAGARLSIIAGGDSRNNRGVRRSANTMVAKLRPHFVMFGGDMTELSTDDQWADWFDDWQLTIAEDGRITPIVVTRGNHEATNQELVELFQVPSNQMYYALNFGGNLLRVYTLNSLLPAGGVQRDWLERDLRQHAGALWKVAQYHHTIRPHTTKKKDQHDQYEHWAHLFHQYGVDLVVESDAHCVKTTWPLAPSTAAESYQGFIRDDRTGTVYVGEGCWGAPLRANDDDKPWTRNSGSFNQFKWIFVDGDRIEVRTIETDNSDRVGSVDPDNIFEAPYGLPVWEPDNGAVIVIPRIRDMLQETEDMLVAREVPAPSKASTSTAAFEITNFSAGRLGQNIAIQWTAHNEVRGTKYELQRSLDGGLNYSTIHAFPGRGSERTVYEKYDEGLVLNPGQSLTYRLVQISPNGQRQIFSPISNQQDSEQSWDRFPKVLADVSGEVKVAYVLDAPGTVYLKLMNSRFREVSRLEFINQAPGKYLQAMNVSQVPAGRYLLEVRTEHAVLRRYRVDVR